MMGFLHLCTLTSARSNNLHLTTQMGKKWTLGSWKIKGTVIILGYIWFQHAC